jgi:hypothetical protein
LAQDVVTDGGGQLAGAQARPYAEGQQGQGRAPPPRLALAAGYGK